jgi:serine/threonine protein kinase
MRSITATGPVTIDRKYVLKDRLGKGGTAEVWRAQHLLGNFPCAVKIMFMQRQSFDLCGDEFRLLSMIYHPNVVRTFDMGFIAETDQAYLSMELISGRSWEDFREDAPTPTQAIGWLRQLVSVLSYLHAAGTRVVHKDIKPANIVVEHARAVLIDFNIAGSLSPDFGTPAYKCPLVEQQRAWSAYADVWALALSFYELTTGAEVFADRTSFGVQLDHQRRVAVPDIVFEAVKLIIAGGGQDVPPDRYSELFGLGRLPVAHRPIPDAVLAAFRVTSRNQTFLLRSLFDSLDPRVAVSKSVLVRSALRNAGLPGSAAVISRLLAVFTELKARGVVEYAGKGGSKARLTEAFTDAVRAAAE